MRINIAQDALQDTDSWGDLDAIVRKIDHGWHYWEIDDPDAVDASGWLEKRKQVRESFEKAAVTDSYRPGATDLSKRKLLVTFNAISDAPEKTDILEPLRAAKFAERPLCVLMENQFSDGLFLDTILEHLAPQWVIKIRNEAPEAIWYDHAGGNGQLPELIRKRKSEVSSECQSIPIRAVAFTDSDAKFPGDKSANAKRVEAACAAAGFACHILRKRAIENYIPDEILDASIPHKPDYNLRQTLEAVKRLSSCQRDHYPMKTRDAKKLRDNPPEEVKSLYRNVNESDWPHLSRGFGKDVIEKLQDHKHAITPDGLRRRDGQEELDILVAKIAEQL
ncbi:MAG: hypothetical protein ACRER2_16245 [Methylococcales bacterium]